jgi:hypothetical protein
LVDARSDFAGIHLCSLAMDGPIVAMAFFALLGLTNGGT